MPVVINGTTGITTPDLDSTADISANSVVLGEGGGSVATNVVAGAGALNSNTTGAGNTALGWQSGFSNQTGNYNTYIGRTAGYTATGGNNTFAGFASGYSVTTGQGNSFLGSQGSTGAYGAGFYVTTGSNNTIIGAFTGNDAGLDIRTTNSNVVLSDGGGLPRQWTDSTNTTYRYGANGNFSFSKQITGQKTAGSSGSSNKLVQIGPTCALTVKIMAIQSGNESNSAQLVGNITVAYGGGGTVAGQSAATQGNISGISIAYDNGGSPIYTINCTLTYSGAAPTIYYVIEGLSTYGFTPL